MPEWTQQDEARASDAHAARREAANIAARSRKIYEMQERIEEELSNDGEASMEEVAKWLGCSPNYWIFEEAWLGLETDGRLEAFRPPEWPDSDLIPAPR